MGAPSTREGNNLGSGLAWGGGDRRSVAGATLRAATREAQVARAHPGCAFELLSTQNSSTVLSILIEGAPTSSGASAEFISQMVICLARDDCSRAARIRSAASGVSVLQKMSVSSSLP
eukprot:2546453-Prymnesium_polylepis.2